jgi:hypothetical protein
MRHITRCFTCDYAGKSLPSVTASKQETKLKPIITAALTLTALTLGTGTARADDGQLSTVICQQLALGQSPGQVAGELHDGNATITRQRATQQVWEALPDCPND